jgi:ArsR family transcriptional regulator
MELGEGLGISPSTISHHVRELRLAGLIQQERKGREIVCCVDAATVDQIVTFFRGLYPSCESGTCAPQERS